MSPIFLGELFIRYRQKRYHSEGVYFVIMVDWIYTSALITQLYYRQKMLIWIKIIFLCEIAVGQLFKNIWLQKSWSINQSSIPESTVGGGTNGQAASLPTHLDFYAITSVLCWVQTQLRLKMSGDGCELCPSATVWSNARDSSFTKGKGLITHLSCVRKTDSMCRPWRPW